MRAVWTVARVLLRRHWTATVLLAVIVGVSGGIVLAAASGASRTSSAMTRFVEYSRPRDLVTIVNGAEGDPSDPAVVAHGMAVRNAVQHLPQVAAVGRSPYLFMSADSAGTDVGGINAFATADRTAYRTMDRPRLLDGRLARPSRAREAVVDDVTAAQRHLRVGSTLRMWAFGVDQSLDPESAVLAKYPRPSGPAYTFRIVGVVRLPSGVSAPPAGIGDDAVYSSMGTMILTPAFLREYAADQGVSPEALPGMEIFSVRLRHGLADLPAFKRAVAATVDPGDGRTGLGSDERDAAARLHGAIHLEAAAFWIFGGLVAAAALVVLGSLLGRQVEADAAEHPTLAALGMSRGDLLVVPMVRAAVIALGGSAVAIVVAVALSPLTPLGLARRAEIHPGVAANASVLVVGGVAVLFFTLGLAFLPAWRAARAATGDDPQASTGRWSRRLSKAALGLGPAAAAGVCLSVGRRRGIAFRTSVVAMLVAVAGIVAALTFTDSLSHVLHTPREQGWTWDVFVGNPNSAEALSGTPEAQQYHDLMTSLLEHNHAVQSYAGVATSNVVADGMTVDIAGIEPIRGSVLTRIVRGRAPMSSREIALGRDALDDLHKSIGDTVSLRNGSRRTRMRIVGQSLQPVAGDLSTRLSGGGVMTLAGLRRVQPDAMPFEFAVRFRPGVDRSAAKRSLVGEFGHEVLRPYPGGEIRNLGRVESLPYLLAVVLSVLAIGALAQTLLGVARQRRREVAVLQTIGFVRMQVITTMAWQAAAAAVIAVVVGIPAGLVIGRGAWRLVAASIGSVATARIPAADVLLVIPVTVAMALVLAAGPAWLAARVKPAEALRSE